MPEFSIITPVLNQASTIEKCIESVAAQCVDVEHIIIDGGSTDGTVDIIRKHEDKLTFWMSEPDRGQSHAINKGLERASGTWFNWLNADDLLTDNALQVVLKTADADTKVVIGICQHINAEGVVIAEGPAKLWKTIEGNLGKYSMGQPSHFYRTEFVRKLKGLRNQLHYCMDMDLWFRYLIEYGLDHVKQTSSCLSNFLVRPDAKTQDKTRTEQERLQVYKALFEQIPLPFILRNCFENVESLEQIYFEPSQSIDWSEVYAHFAVNLLLDAYEQGDFDTAKELFEIAKYKGRLNVKDKLVWRGRLMLN